MIKKMLKKITYYLKIYSDYKKGRDIKLRFIVDSFPMRLPWFNTSLYPESTNVRYVFPKGTIVNYIGEDDTYYYIYNPCVCDGYKIPKEELEIISE